MHGIQAWVALPDGSEEVAPSFAHHGAGDLPVMQEPGMKLRVIAGKAFGKEARDALAGRVLRRPIAVNSRARDGYHRVLGHVTLGGQDLGLWMVSRGYAWSYRYRRDTGPYAAAEAQARQARLGLWSLATQPVEPRVFRKRHGSCH